MIPPIKLIQIPRQWKWLTHEPGPKMLLEGLRHYGLMEHKGKGSFPDFTKWANELNVSIVMTDDDVPWCGLFMGIRAKRCEWDVPDNCFRAASWLDWGTPIHIDDAMLDDVIIYRRPQGHHVHTYVAETRYTFAGLGGNQSNTVNVAHVSKTRVVGVRRAPWKIQQPANVRKIFMDDHGVITSTNEA